MAEPQRPCESLATVTRRLIHADGLVLGDAEPIIDGVVVVEGDTIVDVGPAVELLPRHAGLSPERVRGTVFPGLVNAHTHLELSALRGEVPGGAGFVPWVERLIGMRVETSPDEDVGALVRAVHELDSFGTAAVGEVTNSLMTIDPLRAAGLVGCIFHEVVGLRREAVMARLRASLTQAEERAECWSTPDLSYAPAAHALYTTHPDAVGAIVASAAARGRRTSLHLAEHAAERGALEGGTGPIPAWIESRLKIRRAEQVWPRMSPIDYAASLGALAPHVLLVHLTDARPEELARVAASGAHVVLCPRSNLYIDARLPPLLAMRSAGLECALGTDSLASAPSLDLLAEARALADRFSTVTARELIQMATWNGARALGRPELGRIARGSRPGLLAVDGHPGVAPCAFLLKNLRVPRRWIVRRGERANTSDAVNRSVLAGGDARERVR